MAFEQNENPLPDDTFPAIEESRHSGMPIELYLFTFGPLPEDVYCYTNAEKDIDFGARLYRPAPIARGQIVSSGTLDKTTLDVTIQVGADVTELFRQYPPSYTMGLIVYQGHVNDRSSDFRPVWSGRVLSNAWAGNECTFNCEPVATSMQRPGLRINYQRGCTHTLYEENTCRAPRVPFVTTVTAIWPYNMISVVSFPPGYIAAHFNRGYMEYTSTKGRRQICTIELFDGVNCQLIGTPTDIAVGTSVTFYRGCGHNMDDCRAIHQNILNYGGQPWIPLKNPTNSLTIF